MVKDVLHRASIHFFGSIISKIFAGTVYVLLSRMVSVSEYGVATLGITVLILGDVAGTFGLTQWYQKHTDEREALKTYILTRMLLGGAISFCIAVGSYLIGWFTLPLALTLACINMFQSANSVGIGYHIRHKRVILPSLQLTIQAIPILILISVSAVTIERVFLAYAVGNIIAVLLLFPRISLKELQSRTIPIPHALRASVKYALLTYTSASYARGDAIIVRSYLGTTALGLYGLAYRYLEYAALLPASLVQILFPAFAAHGSIDRKHLTHLTLIMGCIGTLFAVGFYVASPHIISVFHGAPYAGAIILMQILALTLILFFINAPLATAVQASPEVRRFLPFGVANTLLNIGLNIAFVPLYGVQAAAWVMLTTEATGLLINLAFARRIVQ